MKIDRKLINIMKLQNKSRLGAAFSVGDRVKDSHGLQGILTKVTAQKVTVKHPYSTGEYMGLVTDILFKIG
ncbi:hypothetical protein A0256_23190 [Mucilaginibacter sp. PAMC 26640]|nr:hypothetical protein A0256_23190 [Mucilaginibacter sp. PAMC 26640]